MQMGGRLIPQTRRLEDRRRRSNAGTERGHPLLPDIEAANIFYRAIVYFAKAESGGIVLGASAPLVLLSRAETPETKVRSIAIGILTAAAAK